MSKPAKERISAFAKRHKRALLVLAIAVLSQSFTISMPIEGRVVDEAKKPIPGADVVAIWNVELFNPLHYAHPWGAVRVLHVRTDATGRFRIPLAITLHTPQIPFSLLMRDNSMPELVVTAPGHAAATAINDRFGINGPAHSGGFWFVKTTSLDGDDIRIVHLSALSQMPDARTNGNLSIAEHEIEYASSSCSKRLLCRGTPIAGVIDVLKKNERQLETYLR